MAKATANPGWRWHVLPPKPPPPPRLALVTRLSGIEGRLP